MNTPVFDVLKGYQLEGMSRFHMPGHKGRGPLGCEGWDITEIKGADALYEAEGVIAQAEENTTALFGSRRSLWSTEGSSQCVRAMLYLAVTHRKPGTAPVVLAARNVHKSFVYAAALVGFDAEWLWPRESSASLCACPVTAEELNEALGGMETPPCAVYITSPDYLGNVQDVAALAAVAHRHGALLLVDNAHGAYLHFLGNPCHPLDLGADLCCDSAHKTLPVLTGGAYLHIGKNAPQALADNAKAAMSLFGSTSPSYLTMASLDLCNAWLAGEGRAELQLAAKRLGELKAQLAVRGWTMAGNEPLKLTVHAAARGWDGFALADLLRVGGVEPEYAEEAYMVLMASASTTEEDFRKLSDALAAGERKERPAELSHRSQAEAALRVCPPRRAMPIREAVFAPHEWVETEAALGRVCASPTVACPPAIPIAVSGEVIGEGELALFRHYGVEKVLVVGQ